MLLSEIQNFVSEQYISLLQAPYEQGTCKKCLPIQDTPYCVVVMHEATDFAKEMIHRERQYLDYLQKKGFPVVETAGDVFPICAKGQPVRYGLIEKHVRDGVFIEAKTPAPLKLLIFAALTGTIFRATEAWFLQKDSIEKTIAEKLTQDSFERIKAAAICLQRNFEMILSLMKDKQVEISDLQGLITVDGTLTIIDPLDVVKVEQGYTKVDSILASNQKVNPDFISFLKKTKLWLQEGVLLSAKIGQATSVETLQDILKNSAGVTLDRKPNNLLLVNRIPSAAASKERTAGREASRLRPSPLSS